jgi:hypothetical protein
VRSIGDIRGKDMTLTQDHRRERQIRDRAKLLGRWLARFALEEGQTTDELKGQLPALLLVIEQAAIRYFNKVTAEAQAAAKTGAAPSLAPREVDLGSDVYKVLYCSFCKKGDYGAKALIAGPNVFICDACVDLCVDIVRESREKAEARER